MSVATYYKRGAWRACCDTCGKVFKSTDILLRWDGARVCAETCFEQRNAQELIRGPRPQRPIPWSRNCETGCEEIPVVTVPLILQFGRPYPSDGHYSLNDPNVVVSYDITDPNVSLDRTKDVAVLGTGGVTYEPTMPSANQGKSAIYNLADSKMYFVANKSSDGGLTSIPVVVQFDPATLTISNEILLTEGLVTPTLLDVAEDRIWIVQGSANIEVAAFDTTTLEQVFSWVTPGAEFDFSAPVAGNSGQLLYWSANDQVFKRLTVTGFTTYTTDVVSAVVSGTNSAPYVTYMGYSNSMLRDPVSNKIFIPYYFPGAVLAHDTMYALLNLNDLTVQTVVSPPGTAYSCHVTGFFLDPLLKVFVGFIIDRLSSYDSEALVAGLDGSFNVTGRQSGSPSWFTFGPTINGKVLTSLGPYTFATNLGGFDEQTLSNTPDVLYPSSNGFTSAGGNSYLPGFECIVPR